MPSHWKLQSWWKKQSMEWFHEWSCLAPGKPVTNFHQWRPTTYITFLSFSSPKRESRFRIHPRCICTGPLDGLQECYYTTTTVCFATPPVIMAGHHGGFSGLHWGQHVAIVWHPYHIAIYVPTISLSFQQFVDIFRACKNTAANVFFCVNWSIPLTALHAAWALDTRPGALGLQLVGFSSCCLGLLASPTTPYSGINISHLAKRKLIFKCAWKVWDILISRRVYFWNTQGHHEKERKTILEFLVPSWNRNDFSSVKTHHLPGGFCQESAAFLKKSWFCTLWKKCLNNVIWNTSMWSGYSIAFCLAMIKQR